MDHNLAGVLMAKTPPVQPLHDSPTALGLLNFVREELDAGRMAALCIVAISTDAKVFRETWVIERGVDSYVLLGAVEATKQDLHNRYFNEEDIE